LSFTAPCLSPFDRHPFVGRHADGKVVIPGFFNDADAGRPVGIEHQTHHLCDKVIVFFAILQLHSGAIRAAGHPVVEAAGADFAPGGFYILFAPGAFAFQVRRACPAVEAAEGDEGFVGGDFFLGGFHFREVGSEINNEDDSKTWEDLKTNLGKKSIRMFVVRCSI
jgi:hypothetical protein